MDDTSRRLGEAERLPGHPDERTRGYAAAESIPGDDRADATERSGGDPASDDPASPESAVADPQYRVVEIRAEIEQTREDLSETIDAIQERLRPRNIVADATERVRTATTERMKDMAQTAGDTAQDVMAQTRDMAGGVTRELRDNPLPAVLIGIGTAWLLMNRSESRSGPRAWMATRRWDADDRRSTGEYRGGTAEAYDDGADGVYDRGHEGPAGRLLDHLKHHPIPAALAGAGLAWLAFANGDDDRRDYSDAEAYPDSARYRHLQGSRVGQASTGAYDAAVSGVAEAAGSVGSQAEELASRAREYAGEAAGQIRRRGRRAQNGLQRILRKNPLLVGAAAVVAGAAVGMALPESEREKEWMGDARDNLVDRAQEIARSTASRVQEAAGDVAGEVASRVVTGKDKDE